MHLWFAHGRDVSIREQLATQVVLAILSGDLTPGQRLPSTRELARRFRLHPNTVSAGYRQLERDRWVEFRHGSGVYVRRHRPDGPISPGLQLDQAIADLFNSARVLGLPLADVRLRLRHWLEFQPPDHFLLIEPDEELRKIIAMEMLQASTFPVAHCGPSGAEIPAALEGAIPVAFPNSAEGVRQILPAGSELLTLSFRSVPASLAGWLPAPTSTLVGIASRWPKFLKLARTMLVAAGFDNDALVFGDAREANWQRRLKPTAAVICDCLTAKLLPAGTRAILFPLLSESSLAEIRRYPEFVRDPLKQAL